VLFRSQISKGEYKANGKLLTLDRRSLFRPPQGFLGPTSLCGNRITFVGRSPDMVGIFNFSHQRHLPHLRRLASSSVLYPALSRWAKVFRASGAASQLTNQELLATSCEMQIANYNCQVPNGPRQCRSARGAPEASPARKGGERWQ
jgi:hypothetical protein